jgi:hypothetical protein
VLRFEREAVAALTTSTDEGLRSAVETYVDGSLHAMPDFLRIGVALETVFLGAWARLRDPARSADGARLRARLDGWESRSPIGVVRSWVRLLRSLVIYAENELPEAVS